MPRKFKKPVCRYDTKIGAIIGRWTIVSLAQKSDYRKQWNCICTCGKAKIILDYNLKSGNSLSCGCLFVDEHSTGCGEISGAYFTRLRHNSARKGRVIKFDLNVKDLWALFLKQNRKCAITGLYIGFGKNTKEHRSGISTASLDRIDSDKDYTIDNVQWVHKVINRMKWDLQQPQFIEWCKIVVKNYCNESELNIINNIEAIKALRQVRDMINAIPGI